MPTVYNGIGTWYYGRRNERALMSRCSFCSRTGTLASFDTTLYFVVVFIPLVPLKKVRVLDQCPACHKHRVISAKDWNRLRSTDLVDAVLACEKTPGDFESARKAMGMCVLLQDEEAFLTLAGVVGDAQANDPAYQRLLGDCYEFFGKNDDAAGAMRHSMDLKEDRDVRKQLASLLMRTGKVDEGWALMTEMPMRPEDAPWAYLAVEGYQAQNRHQEAVQLLGEMESRFPGISAQKDHKKIVKSAAKAARRGKPVVSAMLKHGASVKTRDRARGARLARFMGPAVALIAILIYLGVAYGKGASRPVRVINGLDKPYTVTIGPARVNLAPGGVAKVNIPEGRHVVHAVTPGLNIADQTIEIHTGFWGRPFVHDTFVINPDRAAVLIWEQAGYQQQSSPSSNPGGVAAPRFSGGEALAHYTGLDYEFEPFPPKITMSSNGSVEKRERVDRFALTRDTVGEAGAALGARLAEILKHSVAAGVSDELPYLLLPGLGKPEEVIAFAKPLMTARPVVVDLHRAYQELMERAHPETDLAAEYRALLAKEPDNAALSYLLGRVVTSRTEARECFQRAASATPPVPHAFLALAYGHMGAGRYDEALAAIEKGLKVDPGRESFQIYRRDALEALGRFDECLANPRFSRPLEEQEISDIEERVYFLHHAGRKQEAVGIATQYEALARRLAGDEAGTSVHDRLSGVLAYLAGNERGYGSSLSAHESADDRVAGFVILGDLDKALRAAAEGKKEVSWQSLAEIYIAACVAGDQAIQGAALSAWATRLARGGTEERMLAQWLKSEAPPAQDEALDLNMTPHDKRLAMTALGQRFPSLRDGCFALARKLNFDTRYPHLLLRRATGE